MLFDLTRVTGAVVDDANDTKVTRHYYMRTADLYLSVGGAVAGAVPAGLLMPWVGSPAALLCPVGALIALLLFSRKRAIDGQRGERRWDRLRDAHSLHDGYFALPGSDVFQPLDRYTLVAAPFLIGDDERAEDYVDLD